ncbi:unnamed protein product [Camellia sinensis]
MDVTFVAALIYIILAWFPRQLIWFYSEENNECGYPRNSLKRVKASIECHVLIKGRGSIKDPVQEEMMQGKPGYEHLNEPLYRLVEAELPPEIVDAHLMQAREILEDLLKPMVTYSSAPEP